MEWDGMDTISHFSPFLLLLHFLCMHAFFYNGWKGERDVRMLLRAVHTQLLRKA
jgi:hypothetical protein